MPASTFEVSGISRRRIMLRVVVLGAAAGGGVLQWNCGCAVCQAARTEHPELKSTQASIAISADGGHWFLINASPDLRHQLIGTQQLYPQAGKLRHSPISGVILTNGEIDAIAGLLSMREGWPFTIYAHPKVLSILNANSIFNVLNEKNVRRQPIEVDKTFAPTLPDGSPSGIEILPFAVPGKSPWYLEGKVYPAADHGAGDTIGLRAGGQKTARGWNGDRALNAMSLKGMTAFSLGNSTPLDSAEELEAALRQIGAVRYHNLHPFHRLLHGGKLNKGQVQAWALNRYYYQSTIPIKDAVVISRFRDRGIRLEWRHRIEDHDGDLGTEGGIERWLKLTEGLGLDSAYVESTEGILPATRFAVEAYVHFVRDKTPLEAIASSLTELFAPNLHEERISGMLAHYDFVNPDIMSYFSRRMQQAPRDANFALKFVKEHAKTPAEREAVCNALIFKTNVLWVQLDALYHAYVEGHVPPGAFVPKEK